MALLSWLNADLFTALRDKVNAVISSANGITFNDTLTTKVIEIGDWNMDANDFVNVNPGIADFTKIRNISIIVRDDSDTSFAQAPYFVPTLSAEVQMWFFIRPTLPDIQISRKIGGVFDSASYNATSYNRGWITITYVK